MSTTPTDTPPPEDNSATLLRAVNRLSVRVGQLSANLTVSEEQHKRTRRISVALGVLFTAFIIGGYVNSSRIADGVVANNQTQVQQCQNANSVRQSNILLWEQILSLSLSGDSVSPREAAALIALQDWIEILYRDRDCDNLDRAYENPPPPNFNRIIHGDDKKVSGNR